MNASKDALVDIFGRIENFLKRLEIYTEVPPTDAMKELIVRIMAQVLEILSVATKEIKQQFASELVVGDIRRLTHPRAEKFVKRLMGRTDIEDALKKLDKLTHEEALMAGAEAVKLGMNLDKKIDKLIDGTQRVSDSSQSLCSRFLWLGENEARVAMQQVENDLSGLSRS